MQAKQAIKLNTMEEKLGWIFSVFDSDGEIDVIVVGIFDFSGSRQMKKSLRLVCE